MALIYQLDFLEEPKVSENKAIERIIMALKESQDRVRKGTYASINEVRKEVKETKERLEILERHLCRG